ncbi:MAG: hypothetical protein Q4A82_02910 [Corynebacterium sp.]|nr:hypothetical protein [Corynebacterium sp.]
MNGKQKHHYRARMAVAQLFRTFLNQNGERARLLERLGVETMPVIVPVLGDTLASNLRETVKRYFENGAQKVIVPICLVGKDAKTAELSMLVISAQDSPGFWSLNMSKLHDHLDMEQVVQALGPDKKWDITELDSQQQATMGRR